MNEIDKNKKLDGLLKTEERKNLLLMELIDKLKVENNLLRKKALKGTCLVKKEEKKRK